MNDDQLSLTKKKFPILFSFSQDYTGSDYNDIRQLFRDKPVLIFGEDYWSKYEQSLQSLTEKDKQYLFGKLKTLTKRIDEKAGWPHFEERLNEALAYRYLQKNGYKKIRFIDENTKNGRKPDLEILNANDSLNGLVEVKTIRFSLDEYAAVKKELETGKGRFLPMQVNKNLYKKITDDLDKAVKQLTYQGSASISLRRIYLFLNLDAGVLMDLIFTPDSDLQNFICQTKKTLDKNNHIDLKTYLLGGIPGEPKELKCKG
ncbi:MAG TPA: hypothetical protein VMR81_04010 [Patescibacteria group bacterium]|nr:hypothetical protein [Patescibacteria group bacterium]